MLTIFLNPRCRINPQNEAAKKGLERLEKQMKVLRKFYTSIFIVLPSQVAALGFMITFLLYRNKYKPVELDCDKVCCFGRG